MEFWDPFGVGLVRDTALAFRLEQRTALSCGDVMKRRSLARSLARYVVRSVLPNVLLCASIAIAVLSIVRICIITSANDTHLLPLYVHALGTDVFRSTIIGLLAATVTATPRIEH